MAKKSASKKAETGIRRKIQTTPVSAGEVDPPTMLLQIRMPEGVVEKIDLVRMKELIPPSRHRWIIEAIVTKLKAQAEEFHVTFQ